MQNSSIVWNLNFLKYSKKTLISLTGDQKVFSGFFCKCLVFLFYYLKAHHIFDNSMLCHRFFFHMDNHINQVGSVLLVERISRWSCTSEDITKKSHGVFFFPGRIIKYRRPHILNPKFKLMTGFPVTAIPP